MPDALYRQIGNRFEPSEFVRGPWSFDHCHAGPPAALLTTLLADVRPEMAISRITCEIPAPIPLEPVRVDTTVVRPGRRISFLRAEMSGLDGTVLMSASAWMMRMDDSIVGPTPRNERPLPPREEGTPFALDFWDDQADFSVAVEFLASEGQPFSGTGEAALWARVINPLLRDRPWNSYARAVATADFPNGIGGIEPMDELIAVNTDLTVYFGHQPHGEWIGIRAKTNSSGLGQRTSRFISIGLRRREPLEAFRASKPPNPLEGPPILRCASGIPADTLKTRTM